jgi:hypothetical protein
MASYIVSCGSNCLSSSASSPCGEPVCEEGYYCDFRKPADQYTATSTSETACVSGLCLSVIDDAVSSHPCSTCEAGSVIVTWKDDYKTKFGEARAACEFVEEECPQYCLTSECENPGQEGSCTGCNTAPQEYQCPPTGPYQPPTTITAVLEKNMCAIGPDGYGAPDENIGDKLYKGLVSGQERLNCCTCEQLSADCPSPPTSGCCYLQPIPSYCMGCPPAV